MISAPLRWVIGSSLLAVATTRAVAHSEHERDAANVRVPATTPSPAASVVRIARIFSDGAILQRGVAMPVWGWATPGAKVTVTLGAETKQTIALSDSSWRATFAAHPVGKPVSLTAKVEGGSQTVRDIVFGDVWIASGQSNMEWALAQATNGAAEVAAANDSGLREYKVPNTWSWDAEKELSGGKWNAATPKSAGTMSAVAYFFARELRSNVKVPIGIINTAWSGASIAPYISRGAQQLDDAAWSAVKNTESQYKKNIRDSLEKQLGALPTVDPGLVDGKAVWAAANIDEAAWRTIHAPGAWERNGYAGLDGIVWLRKSFTLTAAQASAGARLSLGAIDDDDITYVNGNEVGRTEGYFRIRNYSLPASALREGTNVLVIRVNDGSGDGGMTSDSAAVFIESANTRISLAGDWKFRIGMASFSDDGQHINKIPAILYNRMMHPIAALPFKGVIWYQGESNSNNDEQAKAYRASFATLIQSWRKELNGGRANFPFFWVQLPNYGKLDATTTSECGLGVPA